MSRTLPPRRPFPGESEEGRAEREFWERAWDYSQRVEEDASRKAESAVGRAYFDRMSTAAWAEMDAALMPAFKTVALSRIQDAQAFVDRVAVEVTAAEAPACEVTSKRRKSRSSNSSRES